MKSKYKEENIECYQREANINTEKQKNVKGLLCKKCASQKMQKNMTKVLNKK